jgi:hypothetical protein
MMDVSQLPYVDGSELARAFFTFAALVGAAVFGLFARHIRPLATMPSADQVPVNSTHSTNAMAHVGCQIVGPALRAVRLQASHQAAYSCPPLE